MTPNEQWREALYDLEAEAEGHVAGCPNGCPDGLKGKHKFSCDFAGFDHSNKIQVCACDEAYEPEYDNPQPSFYLYCAECDKILYDAKDQVVDPFNWPDATLMALTYIASKHIGEQV